MGLTYEQAVALGIAHYHPDWAGKAPTPDRDRAGPPSPPVPRLGRSKYRAVATTYAGVRFASKAEANRAEALDDMKARGLIAWWIGQPKFRLGCPENVFYADFLVIAPCREGGLTVWVEEVKGVRTPKFVRDIKLWKRFGLCEMRIFHRGKLQEVVNPMAE